MELTPGACLPQIPVERVEALLLWEEPYASAKVFGAGLYVLICLRHLVCGARVPSLGKSTLGNPPAHCFPTLCRVSSSCPGVSVRLAIPRLSRGSVCARQTPRLELAVSLYSFNFMAFNKYLPSVLKPCRLVHGCCVRIYTGSELKLSRRRRRGGAAAEQRTGGRRAVRADVRRAQPRLVRAPRSLPRPRRPRAGGARRAGQGGPAAGADVRIACPVRVLLPCQGNTWEESRQRTTPCCLLFMVYQVVHLEEHFVECSELMVPA